MAIQSFGNKGTEDIYEGKDTKRARKTCPKELWGVAWRKLDAVKRAAELRDLRSPGYGLEKLRGDRKGQHSIRINDQYRICFVWTEDGPAEVEIVDYH